MLGRVRERLNYANVTATLALFIALGGASYAAVSLNKNSVGGRELQNKGVHLRDLSQGVRRQIVQDAADSPLADGSPFGNNDNPCQYIPAGDACTVAAGEEHHPAPIQNSNVYTVNCPAGTDVISVTGEGGGQYPVWTLVTNAHTWDAEGNFSGTQNPEGDYPSLTYKFVYYAFDTDHVQGFAACA